MHTKKRSLQSLGGKSMECVRGRVFVSTSAGPQHQPHTPSQEIRRLQETARLSSTLNVCHSCDFEQLWSHRSCTTCIIPSWGQKHLLDIIFLSPEPLIGTVYDVP